MKVIILMGSESDSGFAKKITDHFDKDGIAWEQHVSSAHKQPKRVLEILEANANEQGIIYVTLAGRSNALSGFVAANSNHPTVACPPFADKVDMMVNIQSTLQMPSNTPVLTVLDPGNCAIAIKRMFALGRAPA